MKKMIYILILIVCGLGLFYFLLPVMGVNVSIAELFGRPLPFLKDTPSQKIDHNKRLSMDIYVKNLDGPRFMYVTEPGDLIVTEPGKGRVLLIPYNNPKAKRTLLTGLKKPHSMDVHEGYLYVAEVNAIGRVKFDAAKGQISGSYERFIKNMPDDGGHWTRTIKFGPDGYGYVSIGSSCNVCIEKNPLRATVSRFKPGDNKLSIFATGLRNSVGFDWSPVDGQLYATDNGRDWLGDHFPPDELNVIKQNQFYGWPYANGDKIPGPDFGKGHEKRIKNSIPPVHKFHPHTAPLGITFIKNPDSPLYKKALVALHGSWNSSVKVGYKVVSLSFENGHISEEDLITGFLKNGKVLGRPVHLVEGKAGELYLSDDYNGVIYLIREKPVRRKVQ